VVARNIFSEALSAYRRALALHKAPIPRALALHKAPIPVDPIARQQFQQDLYRASEALRVALDRGRCRVDILDTLSSDVPPFLIVSRGPQYIDDWLGAVAIRRELEQLMRELVEMN
jgi:hypothetical protein